MTAEEIFGQLLRLGKVWRVVEALLETGSSIFGVKVEGLVALCQEEGARAFTTVTCWGHVDPMQ